MGSHFTVWECPVLLPVRSQPAWNLPSEGKLALGFLTLSRSKSTDKDVALFCAFVHSNSDRLDTPPQDALGTTSGRIEGGGERVGPKGCSLQIGQQLRSHRMQLSFAGSSKFSDSAVLSVQKGLLSSKSIRIFA